MISPSLFKDGDPDDPLNYRGISLLNCVGKLFTSVLNRRLYLFFEETEQISPFQGGFRKHRSCNDQSFIFLCALQKALHTNSNGKAFVCFVDFRKACDSVTHNLLWKKLKKCGIGNKILKFN